MATKNQNILYAVLALSILGVLGVIGLFVYVLVKPKKDTPATNVAPASSSSTGVASIDPVTGRYVLSPFPMESSCDPSNCSSQKANHICVDNNSPKFCVPDANNNYSWQQTGALANSVMLMSQGASASDAARILSSAPVGTILPGGPDTDMSQGQSRNNEYWTYWLGADKLVYSQRVGNPKQPVVVAPFADCNSWAQVNGQC